MGLLLAMSTGYWQMLAFAILQAVVQLGMRRFQRVQAAADIQVAGLRPRVEQRANRFLIDGKAMPRLLIFWSFANKRLVLDYLAKLATGPLVERLVSAYANRSSALLLGLAGDKPLELDLLRSPHTLIVGPTGSGKSALLSRLLHQLATEPLEVWFFDYKSGETINENAAICAAFRTAASSDQAALRQQWQRLFARVDALPPAKFSRLVIVIEELASAMLDRDAATAITQLAAQGRSVGVRIIATSQTASGIPRQLLVNLGNRIVLADADNSEHILLGSAGTQARLPATRQARESNLVQSPASGSHLGLFSARLANSGIDFEFLAVWSNKMP